MINYIFTLWIPIGRKDESVKPLIFKMSLSKTSGIIIYLAEVGMRAQNAI
jgi:hypothetical protein